jgi:hypothetical protein
VSNKLEKHAGKRCQPVACGVVESATIKRSTFVNEMIERMKIVYNDLYKVTDTYPMSSYVFLRFFIVTNCLWRDESSS